MELAEILPLFCRLPTLQIFASVYLQHGWLVLSEIKSFSRMYFTTNCFLKICIRNSSILIPIESLIDLIESFIWYIDSPMVKVKLKFIWFNTPWFVFTESMKWLSYCFPLKLYLFKNQFNNFVLINHTFTDNLLKFPNFIHIFIQILFKLRIFNRVMSKVESLYRMYRISHPSRKVLIRKKSLLLWVLVLDEFL